MKALGTLFSRLSFWFKSLIEKLTISEKIGFYIFAIIALVSTLYGLYSINNSYLEKIPKHGGTIVEGFVGTPRFINPILAVSDTDKDLSSLVYSGLMRPGKPEDSERSFIPDLAESFSISEDGLTYSFILKPNLTFHDGKTLTTEDIAHTIEKIQDPTTKSPERVSWDGVSINIIDATHIEFKLKAPYAAFLTNTTVGILPKHIRQEVSSEEMPFSALNTEPIGSGPYKISKVVKNSQGLVESIKLASFKKFALGEAYIKNINMVFFASEKDRLTALDKGDIMSAGGISHDNAKMLENSGFNTKESPSSRLFALFLNQNKNPVLAHKEIRQAIKDSLDLNMLNQEILDGFGEPLTGPLSPFTLNKFQSLNNTSSGAETASLTINLDEVITTLEKNGWKKNEDGILAKKNEKVIFTISTSDNIELKETAEFLKESWEPLGISVEIKSFESSQFSQAVIRPRDYESLLFGITIGRELDYYSFWHSSQRNDPGLNISLYTNSKSDTLLTSGRTSLDPHTRLEALRSFAIEVMNDNPAIFLYSPNYIYITPENLSGYDESNLRIAGERFYDINNWYIETDKVWNFI